MRYQKILVVDDDPLSLKTIVTTLTEAKQTWLTVDSHEAGWAALQADQEFGLVLLRAYGKNLSGIDLCRQIRRHKSTSHLSVIMMLRENELAAGAETLIAGASDLLVDPFDAKELRLRAGISRPQTLRRSDYAHITAIDAPGAAGRPEVFLPEFDAQSRQINYGVFEGRLNGWDNDPNVTRVALDRIIVCPKCNGIPTIRPGCGACGSAWMEPEILLHHYACAHVGPEADFLTPDGLVCPKCRLRNLVAGSDFEQTTGCLKCSDCAAIFTEPRLLGHCLRCEYRFPIAEGKLKSIYAYEVGRSADAATIPTPSFLRSRSRSKSRSDDKSRSEESKKTKPGSSAGADSTC